MKVIYINRSYGIDLIPRVYPLVNDELTLILRNESTNVSFNPQIEFIVGDLLKVIITGGVPLEEFTQMSKYELTLMNGMKVVYKGKLIVLEEDSDVQNFVYTDQTDSRFKYI